MTKPDTLPSSHGRIVHFSGKLSEVRSATSVMGIQVDPVPLERREAALSLSIASEQSAMLVSVTVDQPLGVCWFPRPGSINFSLCSGGTGLVLEGKPLEPHTLSIYSEPARGSWAGRFERLEELPERPSITASLPLSMASEIGLELELLPRAWDRLCLSEERSMDFSDWALEYLSGTGDRRNFPNLLCQKIRSLLSEEDLLDLNLSPPSHYSFIIAEALSLFDQSTDERMSVTTIARRMGTSTRSLQRAFQSTFGVAATKYFRHRGLVMANQRLKQDGGSVHEVAFQAGFRHLPRFAQYYRDFFGCAPSETRHQEANAKA